MGGFENKNGISIYDITTDSVTWKHQMTDFRCIGTNNQSLMVRDGLVASLGFNDDMYEANLVTYEKGQTTVTFIENLGSIWE